MDIKIPNLGDGISSAVVVSVNVKPGDTIAVDDTLLELETDKAVAPVPATSAGTVTAVHVKEGDTVSEGKSVVSLSGGSSGESPESSGGSSDAPGAPAQGTSASFTPPTMPQIPAMPAYSAAVGGGFQAGFQTGFQGGHPVFGSYYFQSPTGQEPPASPTVRKMATQLGLDTRRIPGSGHGGRISLDDLKQYVLTLEAIAYQSAQQKTGGQEASSSAQSASQSTKKPLPNFEKFGKIERKKISNLRKVIGDNMAASWDTVPHVTQFADVDLTNVMTIRKKINPAFEKKHGIKATVTVFIIKALVDALKKHPVFNTSYDEATQELIYKQYVNIGVAVDTENGLMVPVIKNVDTKSLADIALELNELAEKARNRKISIEDMQGGSFTVSNLGGLGGGLFTPIVNHPEVAILGVSAGSTKPVYVNGKIEPRLIVPICVSYDHRVIDGADGARFVNEVVSRLETIKLEEAEV